MATAGRVLLLFKGDYNSATQYVPLDCVKYQGNTYVCIQTSQNNLPTNTTYFQVLAQGVANAAGLSYDNTNSGLSSNNVQNAIDELNTDLAINLSGQGHNGIYRGKNLGTINSVSELDTFLSDHNISSGTFTDLYLGDYFTLNDGTYNAEWMIAGFNTHINKGNANMINSNRNHLAIIPRTVLFADKMNSSSTTEGGYKSSYMHTTVMSTVTANMNNILGSHMLTRDIMITNAINTNATCNGYSAWTGASSGWEWASTKCELMSEVEVYGSTILSSSFNDTCEACMKLPVFNFINHIQFGRSGFWFRCVANSTDFCDASSNGSASANGASNSMGVRPLILIE